MQPPKDPIKHRSEETKKRPQPSQQVFQIQKELMEAGTPLDANGMIMLVLTAQLDKLEEICLLLSQK